MFIPLGGIFVFGNGISPVTGIVTALFNMLMGGLALVFGYVYGLVFLIVIGYIIAGLGVFMMLLNLFRLKKPQKDGSFSSNEKTAN